MARRSLWSRKGLFGLALWLVVLALVVWALRQVSLEEIGLALSRLTLAQVLLLAAINAGILLLFSARWFWILNLQGRRLPYLNLVGYRLAAFGVSYFTPGPQFGGEPLQVYLLHRGHALPGATAVASVTLDKLLELLANFAFLALGLFITAWGGALGVHLSLAATLPALALFLAPGGYLVAAYLGGAPLGRLLRLPVLRLDRTPRRQNARDALTNAEVELVDLLRGKPLALLAVLAFSLFVWLALLGEYWLAATLLGLPLSLYQIVALLTAARLAFLSPLPGGFVVVEASQVLALQAMGFNPAAGLGLVVLARARDLLLGAVGLVWGGWLIRRLRAETLLTPAGDTIIS